MSDTIDQMNDEASFRAEKGWIERGRKDDSNINYAIQRIKDTLPGVTKEKAIEALRVTNSDVYKAIRYLENHRGRVYNVHFKPMW